MENNLTMGSGHFPQRAYTVSINQIKKVVGEVLFDKFIKELGKHSLEDFAMSFTYDDNLYTEAIYEVYDQITKNFLMETGLTLELYYHNSNDDGARYDDIDGAFWAVGNVMLPSFEAKTFESKYGDIAEANYVIFG